LTSTLPAMEFDPLYNPHSRKIIHSHRAVQFTILSTIA
jgi:hypothetical protein